jgi:hypothetical protein
VVALYLHRGAFEAALADEDQEQDPDRWCSHAPCGQECWQIVSQWVWNLCTTLRPHDPVEYPHCSRYLADCLGTLVCSYRRQSLRASS